VSTDQSSQGGKEIGREASSTELHPTADEQLKHAMSELDRVRRELHAALAARDDLLSSRSWRLTAPLRWVNRRLGAARAGPAFEGRVAIHDDGSAGDRSVGREALPAWMLRPDDDSVDGANATCRFLNLSPGLEGVLAPAMQDYVDGRSGCAHVEFSRSQAELREGAKPSIGFIGSEELFNELSPDAELVCVCAETYESQFDDRRIDYVIVETSWNTVASAWSTSLAKDAGGVARFGEFARSCKARHVPIVLWFTAGGGSFSQFSWLIEYADLVFATHGAVEERVRHDFASTKNISVLRPYIQPAFHNPLKGTGLLPAARCLGTSVVFDGWWDIQQSDSLLHSLRDWTQFGLLIAESEWEYGRVRLSDLPELAGHSVGCLGRSEKLVLSKVQGAELFAEDSLAGEWRDLQRLVRTVAAGSLAARIDGARPWSPDLWISSQNDGTLQHAVHRLLRDSLLRKRTSHLAWRTVMSEHTVLHRLEEVARALGRQGAGYEHVRPSIACILVSMRPQLVENCIRRFRQDRYPNKELIVVLHGDDQGKIPSEAIDDESIRVVRVGKARSLGACLNFAISLTDADYCTKLDDDDVYGPNYLSDLALYISLGDFPVFGKPPAFAYLEGADELVWDSEWAEHSNLVHPARTSTAALVAGGTIGGRTDVLRAIRFSERRRGGSDSDFIRRCYAEGLDVMATDSFNFVRFRSACPGFHTWRINDQAVRERGRVVGTAQDMESLAFI
jgi:hypothetical protein